MKFSYDPIRKHYRLTDYTPTMGSRVIDTDLDLGVLLARHGLLEEESESSDPFEGEDDSEIDFERRRDD